MTRPDAIRTAADHARRTIYPDAQAVHSYPLPPRDTWAVLIRATIDGSPAEFGIVVQHGRVDAGESDGFGAWSYWNTKQKCDGKATWAA